MTIGDVTRTSETMVTM